MEYGPLCMLIYILRLHTMYKEKHSHIFINPPICLNNEIFFLLISNTVLHIIKFQRYLRYNCSFLLYMLALNVLLDRIFGEMQYSEVVFHRLFGSIRCSFRASIKMHKNVKAWVSFYEKAVIQIQQLHIWIDNITPDKIYNEKVTVRTKLTHSLILIGETYNCMCALFVLESMNNYIPICALKKNKKSTIVYIALVS